MRSAISFSPLRAADLLAIRKQPSQRVVLGLDTAISEQEAERIAAQAVAWSCHRDGALIACFGIVETVPGYMGMCWAILTEGLGASHVAVSRFVRAGIAASRLPRIEAMCEAADIEVLISQHGGLDSGQIVAIAMARPTPECRWARLVGLAPAHLLRRYGPTGASVMLFERILPIPLAMAEAA